MKLDGYCRLADKAAVTAAERRCRDRVRLAIGSANWFTVECSAWDRVRWAIGVITLGDGRPEAFRLPKLYCTPYLPGGGRAWDCRGHPLRLLTLI